MPEALLQNLFGALVFVTVALVAFAIGALTSISELRAMASRREFGLMVAINVFLVPLIGFLIVWPLPLAPEVEAGLLLCVICAGGPLTLKVSQMCDADLPCALSLTVVLLVLNVVTLPVWSAILLGRSLTLTPGDLIGVLVLAIVVPVALGLLFRRSAPESSRAWADRVDAISNVTLLLALAIGFVANAQDLVAPLASWASLAVVVIVGVSGVIGWVLPGPVERRRASTFLTLNRATSVALLVVGRAYLDNAEVFVAVVFYGLIQTAVAVGLSLYWRPAGRRWSLRSATSASGAD